MLPSALQEELIPLYVLEEEVVRLPPNYQLVDPCMLLSDCNHFFKSDF